MTTHHSLGTDRQQTPVAVPPDDLGAKLARIYIRLLSYTKESSPVVKTDAALEDLAGPGAAHEVTTDEQP